jgi:hypothetical protein
MSDSVPARPLVGRAVRLLAAPRPSTADTGLVTAVALRLAALDTSGETATRLVTAADQVVAEVALVLGSTGGPREWSETAEGIALLLADRPVGRRHLVAGKAALGSGDKLVDLADRLRSVADEPLQHDDLARALATAVTGPVELREAVSQTVEPERALPRRGRGADRRPADPLGGAGLDADDEPDRSLAAPIPLRRP